MASSACTKAAPLPVSFQHVAISAMRCPWRSPVRSCCCRSPRFSCFARSLKRSRLSCAWLHAVRQFQPVVAGEFPRDRAQLQPVVRDLDGFHFVRVDARPDRVAVFAQHAVLVALFVEHDGAGLPDQLQAALGPLQQLKILFAREVSLRLVGIEGKAVEEFLALCAAGLGGPLGESAGEVVARRRRGRSAISTRSLSNEFIRWAAICWPPPR